MRTKRMMMPEGRILAEQNRPRRQECLHQTGESISAPPFSVLKWSGLTRLSMRPSLAEHDDVLLLHTDLKPFGVLHGFVPGVGPNLQREVEAVLHLRRAKTTSPLRKATGSNLQVGDEKCRVMEQSQKAGRRSVQPLIREHTSTHGCSLSPLPERKRGTSQIPLHDFDGIESSALPTVLQAGCIIVFVPLSWRQHIRPA